MVVGLKPLVAVAADIGLQPGGQRVDHRDTHAVQTARHLVGALFELAAGVQHGHHHVDGRHTGLMHRHRDTAAVVGDLDTAVVEQADIDLVGVAGHRLVDGVVHDLPDQVVQTTSAGGADVHAGTFPDGFQTLEDLDGVRTVGVWCLVRGSHDRTGLLGFTVGRQGAARDVCSQSTGKGGQDRFCGGVSVHLIAPCPKFRGPVRRRTAGMRIRHVVVALRPPLSGASRLGRPSCRRLAGNLR